MDNEIVLGFLGGILTLLGIICLKITGEEAEQIRYHLNWEGFVAVLSAHFSLATIGIALGIHANDWLPFFLGMSFFLGLTFMIISLRDRVLNLNLLIAVLFTLGSLVVFISNF